MTVSGKIQGVFYRAETASRARQSNITGWIRNLLDGCVGAIFEGKEADVRKIIDFCRKDPANAHLIEVDVRWNEWNGEFEGFMIR